MLCEKYHRDFSKTKHWYDGYLLEQYQVYNPKAVVELMIWNKFLSYWSDTGTYEAKLFRADCVLIFLIGRIPVR